MPHQQPHARRRVDRVRRLRASRTQLKVGLPDLLRVNRRDETIGGGNGVPV